MQTGDFSTQSGEQTTNLGPYMDAAQWKRSQS